MKSYTKNVKQTVVVILSLCIVIGGILFSTVTGNAAHSTTCNKVMYYQGVVTQTSQYTHSSQYGICTVSVTELFNCYKCNCGDQISYSRINRQESHSQPHG